MYSCNNTRVVRMWVRSIVGKHKIEFRRISLSSEASLPIPKRLNSRVSFIILISITEELYYNISTRVTLDVLFSIIVLIGGFCNLFRGSRPPVEVPELSICI